MKTRDTNVIPRKKIVNFGIKIVLAVFVVMSFIMLQPKNSNAEYVAVYADSIYVIDDITYLPISISKLTMPSYTVMGAYSVTWNSDDINYYIILEILEGVGNNPRYLARVNPSTGVCEYVGLMGEDYESLTYDSDAGNLYAISGSGISGYGILSIIDINTGAATPLGSNYGAEDQHVIAYNYSDGMIYHWSGSDNLGDDDNLQKIDPVTLVATFVSRSGATYNSVSGAVYVGGGLFAVADDSQGLNSVPRAVSISSTGFTTVYDTIPIRIRGFGFTDPVLPVELISFTSSLHNNNSVTLNWSTSEERNNALFVIERSESNGNSLEWKKIGSVEGNGTSVLTNNYSFKDNNLSSGRYNYRLRQVDFNGNFEYFNLSNEVVIGVPQKFELSQNYPNPFNPSTKIEYQIPADGNVNISVFDNSGREVASLVNEYKSAGYYSISFNGISLSSGVYFYKLTSGDYSLVKKMTLLK